MGQLLQKRRGAESPFTWGGGCQPPSAPLCDKDVKEQDFENKNYYQNCNLCIICLSPSVPILYCHKDFTCNFPINWLPLEWCCFLSQLEELNRSKKNREELGVNLYSSQQELARLQMLLEKQHDTFNERLNVREKAEEKMNSIKELHQKKTNILAEQRKKGNWNVKLLQACMDCLFCFGFFFS